MVKLLSSKKGKIMPELFSLTPKVYHVMSYGAVGDGSTDDTNAIQSAITAASAAGGGKVVLRNNHVVGALTLPSNITLEAEYVRVKSSVSWDRPTLKAKSGFSGDLLSLSSVNVEYLTVRNISINMYNAASGARALVVNTYNGSYSQSDPHNLFENIFIRYSRGTAVYARSREARFKNVVVRDTYVGHGFEVAGTDTFFESCTAATTLDSSYAGFYITGANNHFSQCKAFYGYGPGFKLNCQKNVLVGCGAQENTGPGLLFWEANKWNVVSGFIADSNSDSGICFDRNNSGSSLAGNIVTGFTCTGNAGLRYPTPSAGVRFVNANGAIENNIINNGVVTTNTTGIVGTYSGTNQVDILSY
jgi:Right handed beta helix region/Pectate lyase superfamily protein